MKVELKCFASLANTETCDFKESTTYELEDSETIDSLIQQAGLKSGEVSIAFVNNQIVGFDAVLKCPEQNLS